MQAFANIYDKIEQVKGEFLKMEDESNKAKMNGN